MSLASLVMASSSPRCEIRQLAVYVYPGGIKAHEAERHVVFYGRRGLPVKKPRFIPAQLAHQLAQAAGPAARHRGGVLSRQGLRPPPRWVCGPPGLLHGEWWPSITA